MSFTYTCDNNGNLQTKVAGGNTTTFTFNDDNRLASIAQNGVTLRCVYDHQGNRVKKTYGGSTTVYIGNLYEVTDGLATKHIFAGGSRIASIKDTARLTRTKDHLGGLNFATAESGSVAQHDEYMPFGETRLETGTADLHNKFTDQEEDGEFGLYNYGARYYDPVIGRFISPDSIVQAPQDPQTLNRYSYCRNNPLKYTDPSGNIFGIDDFLFAILAGAALGTITSAISGGNIGLGFLTGAFSGALFFGAGEVASSLLGKVVAHAAAGGLSGGLSSAANGGNFGMGLLTGAFSGAVSQFGGSMLFDDGGLLAGSLQPGSTSEYIAQFAGTTELCVSSSAKRSRHTGLY